MVLGSHRDKTDYTTMKRRATMTSEKHDDDDAQQDMLPAAATAFSIARIMGAKEETGSAGGGPDAETTTAEVGCSGSSGQQREHLLKLAHEHLFVRRRRRCPSSSSSASSSAAVASGEQLEMGKKVARVEEPASWSSGIECHLETRELWEKFHDLGTEMIITKTGRRMFPTVRCSFSGIDPNKQYAVLLDIIPCDNKRYRYAYHRSSWLVAGKADPPPPYRFYPHPDSPFFGEQLTRRQIVSFEKVKLTNNEMDKTGQIILNSMHKFQPRVHVALALNGRNPTSRAELQELPHRTFHFPQTTFTAVTAYQNQLITKLKIDSNPFAKGFRDSSRLVDFERENMESFFDHRFRSVSGQQTASLTPISSASPQHQQQQASSSLPPSPLAKRGDTPPTRQTSTPRQNQLSEDEKAIVAARTQLLCAQFMQKQQHLAPLYALQALKQQQEAEEAAKLAPSTAQLQLWAQWIQLQQHLQSALLLQHLRNGSAEGQAESVEKERPEAATP